MSVTPSQEEARELASRYPLVPIYRDLLADMLTPVRAYSLLCPPGSTGFLLESVEGGERLARYSFIGYRPEPFALNGGNPLEALRQVADEEVARLPGLPRFHGGVVGYLGYEAARHFERLPVAAGAGPPMAESAFLSAEKLVVFDHVTRRLKLLTIHRPDRETHAEAAARLDELEAALEAEPIPDRAVHRETSARPEAWTSNTARGSFEAMVDAAREHIFAGDAFQVVLSQRFSQPLAARPFDV